jgi:hypothetical protein
MPGSIVQVKGAYSGNLATAGTTYTNAGFTVAITLASNINPVRLRVDMDVQFASSGGSAGGNYAALQMLRNPGALVFGNTTKAYCSYGGGEISIDQWSMEYWDWGQTATALTYDEQFAAPAGGGTTYAPSNSGSMICSEIMI